MPKKYVDDLYPPMPVMTDYVRVPRDRIKHISCHVVIASGAHGLPEKAQRIELIEAVAREIAERLLTFDKLIVVEGVSPIGKTFALELSVIVPPSSPNYR